MRRAKSAKRYRRTKAEIATDKARRTEEPTEPKRHRRTKEEMAQVRLDKRVAQAEEEPIFLVDRKSLPIHDLLTVIKEKYEQHRGLRTCDRVLQLVAEYEKLLVEVTAYRHGLKV